MSKEKIIKQQTVKEVWPLWKESFQYEYHDEPHTDAQEKFFDKLGSYIYKKFGHTMTLDEFKEGSNDARAG